MTYFSNFVTLLISLERLRIQTRNFVCTLIVTDTKRKKMKNWRNRLLKPLDLVKSENP